jgi:hypothetical protein
MHVPRRAARAPWAPRTKFPATVSVCNQNAKGKEFWKIEKAKSTKHYEPTVTRPRFLISVINANDQIRRVKSANTGET